MSGIEVAGLVLAVFPIVINGLKQLKEGVGAMKRYKRYRRELARYSRTLETESIVYLNTIELLLEGIIQSKDELDALMEDPTGALFHKQEYEGRLHTRLGRSYDNYNNIIADILEALKVARKEIGIREANAPTLRFQILWDEYSSSERHFKRLKLALSRNIYADLISEIKEANRELKELTKESYILESNRNKRQSKRQSADFKLIRRQARSLYNVVVTGRSWRCTCRKHHMASLRLEPRPWEEDKGKDNAGQAPCLKFRVLISKRCPDDGLEVKWKWRELEIEPEGTFEDPSVICEDDAQRLGLTKFSTISSSQSPVKKKAVSFSVTPATQSTWRSAAIKPSQIEMNPINDICAAVQKKCVLRQRIGFLSDEAVGKHRHDVYLVDEKVRQGMKPLSLESLLHFPKQRGLGSILSRRDRLYIAVTLASSVLQLDGTLWLKRQWKSGDIFFLPLENQEKPTPKIDCAHPYVSWRIVPEDANAALTADASRSTVAHRVPSEILFVLGITLTELCFGQNISDMQGEEDADTIEVLTNYNTANRLIDDVYSESGSRYGDVVRRCLKCPPDVRDASLDNEEFQKAVFESIVTPLRQDFEDFIGGSRIR